nr:LOW QUALITY PROTEIN: uncharacterized protein LOC119164598 [Rhipicephalus microplus]
MQSVQVEPEVRPSWGPEASDSSSSSPSVRGGKRKHGTAAVKRHAGMKKHIDAAARHRDKGGNLLPPKLVQGTLDFSNGSANTSLEHQVSKAETTFALSVVAKGIPFSWGDTATSIYHCMFPDSDIAKKFSCGRIKLKLARIVSDGLGPYFKGQVVTELCQPNVYFSIMIDETPKPELRVQQLDVLVRYFSSSQQEVVVEHVQSFDLGRATAEIIVGCIEEAIADLPKQGLVCFFSDGPNVMKSVRNKLQKHVAPSLIDIGNCNLHKVHNAFGRGLNAFGLDVEEVVRNIYYYFKGAVRAEALRECQDTLGISCHVFLRHVSNRWLTLQDSLCRVEEQFEALRTYFFKGNSSRQRPDTQSLHNKLVSAFSEKQLLAKVLFLKNCAQLFSGFQLFFQKQEPLLHILHVELIVLVQRVLSRFLRHEAFADKSAEQLKRLDVMGASLWKSRPEVGTDTEKSMLEWDSSEKKRFYLGARAFYLACAKDLLQKLPLDNRVLQSASLLNWQSTNVESKVRALKYLVSQLPQVIKHEEVSSAIDEWHMLKCDSNSDLLALGGERIDVRWGKIFELKSPGGQPKYPLLSRLVKCLLCLPHGNADCERGFSENKRFYENRYSLCIASINGLRQTKTYLRRYDGDATKVPLSTELLQSVRRSRARYTERTASAQQSRKRLGDQDTGADVDEKQLRKNLEEKVTSSRALLKRAEDIISSGLRSKSLEQVEAGQTLLAEGNSASSQTLSQLEELSKKVSKRTYRIYTIDYSSSLESSSLVLLPSHSTSSSSASPHFANDRTTASRETAAHAERTHPHTVAREALLTRPLGTVNCRLQAQATLIHNLQPISLNLLEDILSRFVRPALLKQYSDICSIDYQSRNVQKDDQDLVIGHQAKCVVEKLKPSDKKEFFEAVRSLDVYIQACPLGDSSGDSYSSRSTGESPVVPQNAALYKEEVGIGGAVSLSEYRQRMRDTARQPPAAVPAVTVLDSPVKRSSLGRPHDIPADTRAIDDDESWPQRERLSQRLRREFGLLDDDSDTERGTTSAGQLFPTFDGRRTGANILVEFAAQTWRGMKQLAHLLNLPQVELHPDRRRLDEFVRYRFVHHVLSYHAKVPSLYGGIRGRIRCDKFRGQMLPMLPPESTISQCDISNCGSSTWK